MGTGNKENHRAAITNTPLTALQIKEMGDVRSGSNYYDKWSKYTHAQVGDTGLKKKTTPRMSYTRSGGTWACRNESRSHGRRLVQTDDDGFSLSAERFFRSLVSDTVVI